MLGLDNSALEALVASAARETPTSHTISLSAAPASTADQNTITTNAGSISSRTEAATANSQEKGCCLD